MKAKHLFFRALCGIMTSALVATCGLTSPAWAADPPRERETLIAELHAAGPDHALEVFDTFSDAEKESVLPEMLNVVPQVNSTAPAAAAPCFPTPCASDCPDVDACNFAYHQPEGEPSGGAGSAGGFTSSAESGSTLAAAGPLQPGCWTLPIGIVYKNAIFRFKVMQYNLVQYWCFDGVKITSASYNAYPTMHTALLWRWTGKLNERTAGGAGTAFAETWSQGHFEMCLPAKGCLGQKTPWLQITVTGHGTYAYDGAG